MVKLLRRIINLFKKCKMAKINNTAAYAISTPVVGSDIVIGSALGNNGDTKNFQMSDISTFVLGNAVTPTLDAVCQQGASTTTGITVAGTTTLNGALDANSTADISGNTTIGGTLGVTGGATFSLGATINGAGLAVNGSGGIVVTDVAGITSAGGPVSGTALNTSGGLLVSGISLLGEIDSAGPADIADTLTLSKASGTGLAVTANATIGGTLTMGIGDGVVTSQITAPSLANIAFYMGGVQIGAFVAPLGTLALGSGLNVISGSTTLQDALVQGGLYTTPDTPASASASGAAGQISVDANYIYVCTATNTWKRVAIATW
jgi:hypothetical protein